MRGPSRLVTARGSLRQRPVASLYLHPVGVGVACAWPLDHWAHGSGRSLPLHWPLNRWVPEPGLHRPKLKTRALRRTASSITSTVRWCRTFRGSRA